MAKRKAAQVAIIMGSDSDWRVMKQAAEALDQFQVTYKKEIISAHRTPKEMLEFSETAAENGYRVIIAGAGGAAHLPGMVAALTDLPVIGVPVTATKLNGLDSLLSIAQMPKAVPVATMAIDGAFNAGLFAARILGVQTQKKPLQSRLKSYRDKMRKAVKKKRLP